MTKDELLDELNRLIHENHYSNPAAASTLSCLAGALVSGMENDLSRHTGKFARAAIEQINQQINSYKAKLN